MDSLKDNWLTDGLIDLEYKKYVLLAYLKTVRESFGRIELYPKLAELIVHYRKLVALRENKAALFESFPKELSLENLKTYEVQYRKLMEDDLVMKEIESILEFSLPQIKSSLDEGSSIYDFVESKCELTPVGVVPLYANEGYLFITQPPEQSTEVYRYQVSFFQNSDSMRSLQTQHVCSTSWHLSNPYESIKLNLTRQFPDLPNPAAFLIISRMKFPYTQTLVPIAKRLLVRHLAKS